MIKAAINGIRTNADHPLLPFDAEAAAEESARSVSAGAEAIHVHVWNSEGRESLQAADVTRFLKAIRHACPRTPVGISTGEWIVPDLEERLRQIQAWEELPDFVSLNTDEPGFEKIADQLINKNIGIEAGICNMVAARAFANWEKNNRCIRILIEPNEKTFQEAKSNVEMIESILDQSATYLPRLLHGLDKTAWPMVELAAARGYDTRIGFEDSGYLPGGQLARSNKALVLAAKRIMDQ